MEEKKIRLGIFGLGRGASFYSVIKAHGGEVVAICDGNEERIKSSLEKLGEDADKATAYTDFEEFFKHDMDAVFIANCFHEHTPYGLYSKHVSHQVHSLYEYLLLALGGILPMMLNCI